MAASRRVCFSAPVRPAALAFLLLLLGTPAGAQDFDRIEPPPPGSLVEVQADRMSQEPSGLLRAEGNVRLRVADLHLAADEAEYDPEGKRATLQGRVTLVDGRIVVRAHRVSLDLITESGTLESIAFYQKREAVDPEAALAAPDPLALRELGENLLELHAETVARLPDGTYMAMGPTVTTCDCEGTPDWQVSASAATLTEDDRLSLDWPVFYAKGLPVLALPWFSLPLTDERRSGLLQPSFSILGRRGPSFEQPLYLVLGHSYDLTLSAGYYFGHSRPVLDAQGEPVIFQGEPLQEEVAFLGPRGTAEFRYAPRLGTSGRAFAAYGYDLSKRPTAANREVERLTRPGETGQNPHRFAVQLDHADRWSELFSDRISLNLVSDRNYIVDFTDDIVLRGEQVMRSTGWVAAQHGAGLAVLEGVYFQDLRPPFGPGVPVAPGFEESVRLFGRGQRDTLQRLPAAALDVARFRLPGGAGFSLHLGAARFAPLGGKDFRDVGRDGLGPGDAAWPGPDEGEDDGIFGEGEIPSVHRLSIRPSLSWPMTFGKVLALTPYAGWRQQLYDYGPSAAGSGAASWALAGAEAHTELARVFPGGIRHAWIPRLEARHLHPIHESGAPDSLRLYDELDLRPLRAVTQGRASLASRLDFEGPDGGQASLVLEGGQEATLGPTASLGETFLDASLRLAFVDLGGLLRWDPREEEISESVARLRLTSPRGDQLRAGYRRIGPEASTRLRAGPDELFADAFTEKIPLAFPQELEQVGAGATVFFYEGLSLSYDLLFLPPLPTAKLLEQRATLAFLSACRCWGGSINAAKRRNENVSLWVSLHLGEF